MCNGRFKAEEPSDLSKRWGSLSIHIHQPLRYIIDDEGPSLLMARPCKLPDCHPALRKRGIIVCRQQADFTHHSKASHVEVLSCSLTLIEEGSKKIHVMCTYGHTRP